MDFRAFVLSICCATAGAILLFIGSVSFDPTEVGWTLSGVFTFGLPLVLIILGVVLIFFAWRLLRVAMLGFTVIMSGLALLLFAPPSARLFIWQIISASARSLLNQADPGSEPTASVALLDRLNEILTRYGILAQHSVWYDGFYLAAGVAVVALGARLATPVTDVIKIKFKAKDSLGGRRSVTYKGPVDHMPEHQIERFLNPPVNNPFTNGSSEDEP